MIQINGNCSEEGIQRITRLQKRAARIIPVI
jgi:hypothetical protein